MAQPKTNERPPAVWVRLHLEPQSERSTMPPYIDGLLSGETATTYQLTKVLKVQENEEDYEMEFVEVDEHHHISKTYVWNCQVLGERPVTPTGYNGEGGLG